MRHHRRSSIGIKCGMWTPGRERNAHNTDVIDIECWDLSVPSFRLWTRRAVKASRSPRPQARPEGAANATESASYDGPLQRLLGNKIKIQGSGIASPPAGAVEIRDTSPRGPFGVAQPRMRHMWRGRRHSKPQGLLGLRFINSVVVSTPCRTCFMRQLTE